VQGETLAIRAAEAADNQARRAAAASNTRGSSIRPSGENSTSPAGNRLSGSGSDTMRTVQLQDEGRGERGEATSHRDNGKRLSVVIIPTKEDQADALKPVYSGEDLPVPRPVSPPPPQTTLSVAPAETPSPSRDRQQHKQQRQLKSSSQSGSKSKSKRKQQQPATPKTTTTESGPSLDGSSIETQVNQLPQPSQRLVPLASS